MDSFKRNLFHSINSPSQQLGAHSHLSELPSEISSELSSLTCQEPSFQAALQAVTHYALETFKQEIAQQQLYYHGIDHIKGVARRARLIFDTVVPYYQTPGQQGGQQGPDIPDPSLAVSWSRQRDLLQFCAIAHDMLQIFIPQASPHTSRQRQSGHSEQATIDRLLMFTEQVNTQQVPDVNHNLEQKQLSKPQAQDPKKIDFKETDPKQTESPQTEQHASFTPADIALLQEAIEATICQFDASDGSIYQPLLYRQHRGDRPLSLVARSLALADLGTLGMEGIAAYRREGQLLLLEENLDILTFLQDVSAFDDQLQENLRQRLLKRSRFDVSFAKGRLARLDTELEGLPVEAIATLKQQVFTHLTPQTITVIAAIAPTADDTPLGDLLRYFHLQPQESPRL